MSSWKGTGIGNAPASESVRPGRTVGGDDPGRGFAALSAEQAAYLRETEGAVREAARIRLDADKYLAKLRQAEASRRFRQTGYYHPSADPGSDTIL